MSVKGGGGGGGRFRKCQLHNEKNKFKMIAGGVGGIKAPKITFNMDVH